MGTPANGILNTNKITLGGADSGAALFNGLIFEVNYQGRRSFTWAMLLIGFAGIGFISYRRSALGHPSLN